VKFKFLIFLALLLIPTICNAQSIPFPGPGGTVGTIGVPTSLGNGTATASGSTQAFALSGAIVTGNTVFVEVFTQQAGPTTVSSMSDGTNTYTKATSNTQAASVTGELWYVINAVAVATPTVTATMSGSATANATVMAAAQVAGIVAFDKTAVAGASAAGQTTLNSGSTTALTTANELVIGTNGINTTPAVTESAGYTNINNGNPQATDLRISYKIVNSTTAVNYSPSIPSTTCTWVSIVATFR